MSREKACPTRFREHTFHAAGSRAIRAVPCALATHPSDVAPPAPRGRPGAARRARRPICIAQRRCCCRRCSRGCARRAPCAPRRAGAHTRRLQERALAGARGHRADGGRGRRRRGRGAATLRRVSGGVRRARRAAPQRVGPSRGRRRRRRRRVVGRRRQRHGHERQCGARERRALAARGAKGGGPLPGARRGMHVHKQNQAWPR
jgi:hypothetical protein